LRTDSAVSPVTVGSLPEPGESIFALAATENAAVMTEGIVSTESFSLAEQGEMHVFAADIRCESVGAVIFDSAGRAVGLTVRCGENMLPLAVPMEEAKAVAESIIESGADSGRAALGIVGESVSSGVAQYYDMTRGVYIWSVTPGSGAEKAGLRSGDIITALGDTEITDTGDLSLAERGYNAGDTGVLTLYRGGESITVEVTFDNQ